MGMAKAEAKERVDLNIKQMRDGVASRKLIAETVGLIKEHGLGDGDLYDVAKLQTEAEVRRETRALPPAQLSALLARQEAEIAKAGDKATPEQLWRRDVLAEVADKRRATIDADPYAWVAQNGIAAEPADLADPASINARIALQGRVRAATGRPAPFFTRDEAAEWQARAAGEAKDRAAVAEALARIPGAAGRQEAERIAPKDWMLQLSLDLLAGMRREAFEGEEARKGNPALSISMCAWMLTGCSSSIVPPGSPMAPIPGNLLAEPSKAPKARRSAAGTQDGAAALNSQLELYEYAGGLRLWLVRLQCAVMRSQGCRFGRTVPLGVPTNRQSLRVVGTFAKAK